MNEISSLNSMGSWLGTDTTTKKSSSDSETATDYMLLLLSELKHQDPTDPMSNAEMMTQFAQLTTVQEITKLSNAINDMVIANSLSYATALVGKHVVSDIKGVKVEGKVSSIEIEGTECTMTIGDESGLPLTSIVQIVEGD